jgi:hypothetical protein
MGRLGQGTRPNILPPGVNLQFITNQPDMISLGCRSDLPDTISVLSQLLEQKAEGRGHRAEGLLLGRNRFSRSRKS